MKASFSIFFKSLSIFLTIFLFVINSSAQDDKKVFTRQDTVRGTLSAERACFDVLFYDLNIRVNPKEKSIKGFNRIKFLVVNDFNKIQLDLFENLKITKITQSGKELKFKREGNAFFVDFSQTQKKGKTEEVTVFYEGKPTIANNPPWDGGFTWRKDVNGNDWIGVSCEGIGASIWWPNKDHLSDEPDSMKISCEVPSNLMCVANGNLKKQTKLKDGYTKYDWHVSYPINNYNVSLNIAEYAHFNDTFKSTIDGTILQLDYYVLPENLIKAKKQFQQVKPMLECYEKYLGKYPFWNDGYALVETPYLGMEHQSAVAYGNQYKNGYLGRSLTNYPMDFDYIIIHESGHEWWGNLISMKDAADMWIHESFCTYTEGLYVECMKGKTESYKYWAAYIPTIQNDRPIIGIYGVNYDGSSDMYPKGAVMLHTIRNVVNNDELWFATIKGLLENFKYKTVTSDEVIAYINKKTGKDLTLIFDQYLKYRYPPTLVYKIEQKNDKIVLTYQWKADVKDFKMPIKVGFGNDFQWITPTSQPQSIELKGNAADFKIATDMFYMFLERL